MLKYCVYIIYSIFTTSNVIITAYKALKKSAPEYISWIYSLSNYPTMLWMQHKTHDCGKIPSPASDVGNVFLTEIGPASHAVFLYDIYVAPAKHFTVTAFFFFIDIIS